MVDGKAKLLRDNYCDGLGDCLPTCPTGAISFVEREAAAYDEKAVQEHMRKQNEQGHLSATLRAMRSFSSVWVALRSCHGVLTELEGSAAPP